MHRMSRRAIAALLALCATSAVAQFDNQPATTLTLRAGSPQTTIAGPARAVTVCGDAGIGLPVQNDWVVSPSEGTLELDVQHTGVGRVVVTDIGSLQVIERTDHRFRARGFWFDMTQVFRVLNRIASTGGNFEVVARGCPVGTGRCARRASTTAWSRKTT